MTKGWPSPNGWFSPQRKSYLFKCCQCGNIHELDFRINRTYKNRDIIQMRVRPHLVARPTGRTRKVTETRTRRRV